MRVAFGGGRPLRAVSKTLSPGWAGRAGLRVGLALLLALPLLGSQCRLRNEPTEPQAWARIVRVTYTRPPEFVNPAWCSESGRLDVRTLSFGVNQSFEADSVTLGPPDVYVWDRSLGDRRFVEGAWVEMRFTEICVPKSEEEPGAPGMCWTGERLEPEVEVPPGYRLEREVVPYAPCSEAGLKKQSTLRIRIVRE